MKIFLIAFAGTHIPLIGLIIFILYSFDHIKDFFPVIAVVFILTLGSTVLTIWLINKLLVPLKMAKTALERYVTSRELPQLPDNYNDEVGQLLKDIKAVITTLDTYIGEKEELIAILSHDIRSPLAQIIAVTQLIEIDEDAPKKPYTSMIKDQCEDMLNLLESILNTFRESEMLLNTIDMRDVSLRKIVVTAVERFSTKLDRKSVAVIIDIDENLEVYVDNTTFSQVIKNLLDNALKFSYTGSSIYVKALVTENSLALSIRDEGMGFDATENEKLFEKFTRSGQTGVEGEHSTGLGLYLSRRIIERQGGKLVAEGNGADRGATFIIYLPVIKG